MRIVFLGAILIGLLAGGIFAGVRALTGATDDEAAPGAITAPEGSPLGTTQRFAALWTSGDTEGLYLLLTPQAQARVSLADFQRVYRTFANEVTQRAIAARATRAEGGSSTIAVHIETRYFGDMDYTVTLNLALVERSWRADWQPTAVHPAMVEGRQFRSTIERPRRGAILDRNGVPLAETREVRMLGLDRSLVKDTEALKAGLVRFGFTSATIDAALSSTLATNQRVPVGQVSDARAEEAATLPQQFPGVILYFESTRVHPLGPAAAHVIGYTREYTADELAARKGTGVRAGDRLGAMGLEAGLERELAGQVGAELRLVTGAGDTVSVLHSRPFVQGASVTTTLDAEVLRATQARLGDRAGAAVVLDPRTNAVLALNSNPTFDPGAFERGDAAALAAITSASGAPLANRATSGLYAPGSTFKLITGAAGFLNGVLGTNDRIFCGATWAGIEPPRRNWEGTQGSLTVAEALMRSCNPVFYEIAFQLYRGHDGALATTARAFGLGSETGLTALDEAAGLVPDAAWKQKTRGQPWYGGDEVNMGIGQGDLLVTPIQLAVSYSAFLARELRVPVMIQGATATSRGSIPLSDADYAHLRRGLELVTGPGGTARSAFWEAGFRNFAGKSGTAEDAGALQHVLFVAYAPASAPVALGVVVLDEGQSGSVEAGPIARDIVLAAMR